MATTIVTKNSSTASAVPTAAQLVQGELAVNVADKRLYTEDNAGAIVELGTNPSTLTVAGEITANGGIALGDNDKATFGASDDLQIYHDGGNSIITNSTGNLIIRDSVGGNILIQGLQNQPSVDAIANGAVNLYYSGNAKLATTSTGIDVTGTATMDGLTVQNSGSTLLSVGSTDGSGAQLRLDGSANGDFAGGDYSVIKNENNDLVLISGTPNGDIDSFTHDGSGNKLRHKIGSNGDISFYEDTGTTAKFFWDASAESLGIGTSAPASALSVATNGGAWTTSSSDGVGINYNSGNANISTYLDNSTLKIGAGVTQKNGMTIYGQTGGNRIQWDVAGSERMRIDASGNVLVGKTATAYGTAGVVAYANGGFTATKSADAPVGLNRLSSDGSIINFAKDGTSVGSIGSRVTNLYTTYTANGFGLTGTATTNGVIPSLNGGVSNGAVDLGGSAARFKDLYLSGGVYLGGTGAANKLDDYEEGTWTPLLTAVSGTKTWTYSAQRGTYTKVGNLVTVFFNIQLTSNGSGTDGNARITGLPFLSATDSALVAYYAFFWKQLINTTEVSLMGQLPAGGDYITFLDGSSSYPDITYINTSVFVNDRRVRGTMQYRV
jgi:hypothetical protein